MFFGKGRKCINETSYHTTQPCSTQWLILTILVQRTMYRYLHNHWICLEKIRMVRPRKQFWFCSCELLYILVSWPVLLQIWSLTVVTLHIIGHPKIIFMKLSQTEFLMHFASPQKQLYFFLIFNVFTGLVLSDINSLVLCRCWNILIGHLPTALLNSRNTSPYLVFCGSSQHVILNTGV